jgi:hypothetical protein
MRWTPLLGLEKLSMQAMLTFAAMNLKKLANWTGLGKLLDDGSKSLLSEF